MANIEKLKSIKEMTEIHFRDYPQQPVEAIKEYMDNALSEEQQQELKTKLQDEEYNKKFQTAIIQTSFLVILGLNKALNPEVEDPSNEYHIDFSKYVREFLFFAKNDDKAMSKMRVYYFKNINAEEVGLTLNEEEMKNVSPQERKIIEQELILKQKTFNKFISEVKTNYTNLVKF